MDKVLGSLKSKTAWFALALVVLGALQGQTELLTNLAGDHMGTVMSIIGGAVYILRLLTNQPLEDK